MDFAEGMAVLAAIFVVILIVGIFVYLVSYIFGSFGLFRMGQNAGVKNSWVVFIPLFGMLWVIGELISEKLKGKGGLKLLLIGTIGLTLVYGNLGLVYVIDQDSVIFLIINLLSMVFSLAMLIFNIMIYYWLFSKYTESAVLHTILSVFLNPLYPAIVLFNFRNRNVLY